MISNTVGKTRIKMEIRRERKEEMGIPSYPTSPANQTVHTSIPPTFSLYSSLPNLILISSLNFKIIILHLN